MGTFVGRLEYDRFGRENNRTGTIQEIAEATRRKVVAIASPEIERLKVPVAALIDGASGSGSEIMAGALREQLGAKLYGRRSAGAVLASLIQPIGDDLGFLLQYPVTDYVTIKGLRIEGNGVQPDFSFPIGKFGEPDRALDAAVEGLKAARM
jgi:carboxyl-terminal processing protease